MQNSSKAKMFVDHVLIKKRYEENKKIVLDKITGKENIKLKLNLKIWANINEITDWFELLKSETPVKEFKENISFIVEHIGFIKKQVDAIEISEQLKRIAKLTNVEEIKENLARIIVLTNVEEIKENLARIIALTNVEEIKEKLESVRNEIHSMKNTYEHKINYGLGKWFLETISDDIFDQNEFKKIIKLLLEAQLVADLETNLKLIKEEKKKIIFDALFSVFASFKDIKKTIQTDKLNLFAEATQDADLHNLLFKGDPTISEKLKAVLPYNTCKKLVELLCHPVVGYKIFNYIFESKSEASVLLSESRIKPKNLIFDHDGIWLQKRFAFKKRTEPIELTGNTLSFAVDSCATIFVLEEINGKSQIKRVTAKDDSVILQNLPLSKKIDVNDFQLFVLDSDGSSITVFDRTKSVKEIKKFKKEDFGDEEIEDISTDRNGSLLLLTKKYHVYRINLALTDFVHLCEKTEAQKNVDQLSGDKLLAAGKNNDNIYVFFTEAQKVLVYNQNMEYLRKFGISENIKGFTVFDGNNFVVSSETDKGIKIQNHLFGDTLEINTTNSPTDKIYQNRKGDLFVLTKAKEIASDNAAFFIEDYEPSVQFVSEGEIVIGPFDSGMLKTKWHKIQLNVEREEIAKTTFNVSVLASDIPLSQEEKWNEYESNTLLLNPSDSLVDATGRFVWLKVSLFSKDGAYSPIFKDVKIYYPRDSYLRYLPKIYQENPHSKELLERYLSLFEKFFDDIDEKIFSFHKLLDPISTDRDFLPWLTTWIALNYDKRWSEENLRNLLNYSSFLYKLRGTSAGLRHMITFYLDSNYKPKLPSSSLSSSNYTDATENHTNQEKIIVFENFQLKSTTIDKYPDYFALFGTDPYSFTVLTNSSYVDNEKLAVIRTLIENEKPSHTNGEICLLNPLFILNGHTYLEVNTELTEPKLILEKSAIGRSLLM